MSTDGEGSASRRGVLASGVALFAAGLPGCASATGTYSSTIFPVREEAMFFTNSHARNERRDGLTKVVDVQFWVSDEFLGDEYVVGIKNGDDETELQIYYKHTEEGRFGPVFEAAHAGVYEVLVRERHGGFMAEYQLHVHEKSRDVAQGYQDEPHGV